MTEKYVAVDGIRCTSLRLVAGERGPWVAEANLESDAAVSGQVTITVGDLSLVGAVDVGGTYAMQRKVRIVAGRGAWARSVPAKDYANDAGIKARLIADDAARAVGEQIGTFTPSSERVGVHYARAAGAASTALEGVIGSALWWVDYVGVTQVGPRAAATVDPNLYEVTAYDPRSGVVTLTTETPSAIVVGRTIAKNLDAPLVIRELEINASATDFTFSLWCGAAGQSTLYGLLRALVQHELAAKLYGAYRYRVVRMSVDRVELQSVRKGAGLPDVLPVSMWPGVAGAHAVLTPGAEVLVEFVEGDRTMPVVTHFAGKDGPGFTPVSLVLGGPAGPAAARLGDQVTVPLPPATFTGTVDGLPASGTLTFITPDAIGQITSGSTKVSIA
jgi:hypothetical protein